MMQINSSVSSKSFNFKMCQFSGNHDCVQVKLQRPRVRPVLDSADAFLFQSDAIIIVVVGLQKSLHDAVVSHGKLIVRYSNYLKVEIINNFYY